MEIITSQISQVLRLTLLHTELTRLTGYSGRRHLAPSLPPPPPDYK
jgi:hypothetical protein